MRKSFERSGVYNTRELKFILNSLKTNIEVENGEKILHIKFGDTEIAKCESTHKKLLFQHPVFNDLILNKLKENNINPLLYSLTFYEDGQYELSFMCKGLYINGEDYVEYISLSDSVNGKISTQLNMGLLYRENNSKSFITYNNSHTSHRIKHSKFSYIKKIEQISDKLKLFTKAVERQTNTLERLKNEKVSYRSLSNKLIAFDSKGQIKLGERQKILGLDRRIRKNINLKDEILIEALKTPEKFLESGLDFNVNALDVFHQYMDMFSNKDAGAVCRETDRIIEILFTLFEENNIQNKCEKLFENKVGIVFKKYYNKHFNNLSWHLAKYTKSLESAQEFANEAFIQALEKIESYNPEKSQFNTWLYRIAENIVKKSFKDEKRLNVVPIDNNSSNSNDDEDYGVNLLNLIPYDYGEDDLNQQVLIDKKAEIIRNVIYTLPKKHEKYKKVLIMREIDCMQYQEISNALGINLSTIKSQLLKGRELVSKKVDILFKNLE
jgi:RNA polymerase sigma-70 factor (ECF subfamily)